MSCPHCCPPPEANSGMLPAQSVPTPSTAMRQVLFADDGCCKYSEYVSRLEARLNAGWRVVHGIPAPLGQAPLLVMEVPEHLYQSWAQQEQQRLAKEAAAQAAAKAAKEAKDKADAVAREQRLSEVQNALWRGVGDLHWSTVLSKKLAAELEKHGLRIVRDAHGKTQQQLQSLGVSVNTAAAVRIRLGEFGLIWS